MDLLECLAIGIRLSNARDNVSAPRPERILIAKHPTGFLTGFFQAFFGKRIFFFVSKDINKNSREISFSFDAF